MGELLQDLWKDKPLLIAVVVGVGAVIYILIKNSNANAASALNTTAASQSAAQTYPVGPAATYVEESYYAPRTTNTTSTSSTTQSVTPVATSSTPSIIAPANKGTLGTQGAGKADTNFWVYTIPPGQTLLSVAQFAKWGNDTNKLANYRNNLQILQAAGVQTSNPTASIPAGLQISV